MLTFEAKKIEKNQAKMIFLKFLKMSSKCIQKVPDGVLGVHWVLICLKQLWNIIQNDF